MKIAIVCTVHDGGMVHFAQSCFFAAAELGNDAMAVFPKGAAVDFDSLEEVGEVYTYDSPGGIRKGHLAARVIFSVLEAFCPDSVWLTDETVTSVAVRTLCPKSVVFIHDVRPHLAKMSAKARFRFAYLLGSRKRAFAGAARVVVMSNSAKNNLVSQYGRSISNKISVLRLGATAPDCPAVAPPELGDKFSKGFFLFFGAIEKYKNVEGLVWAFSKLLVDYPTATLVIAGRGTVEKEVLEEISRHRDSVVFLNRYISDGELAYLMKGARATLLPYLEATQSGVLPISYSFGKPVVTSGAPGLAEFVVHGETGFVVENEAELIAAMVDLLDDTLSRRMGEAGHLYAKRELDFTGNVAKVISDITRARTGATSQKES